MCIVALAWQVLDDCPLFLIANRDEFYHRPSKPLSLWPLEQFYAGQDLLQGGTWLGVKANGRWAIVTNYREPLQQQLSTSRGDLVKEFLMSGLAPIRFAQHLTERQQDYAGFNLIIGNHQQAVYLSNRGEAPQVLPHGVYVLSNGLMTEHWYKTTHLRKRFTQELLPLVQQKVNEETILAMTWDILEDERKLAISQLPDTGIGIELEHLLSSTFIRSKMYGTRCSNLLRLSHNRVTWYEKNQAEDASNNIISIRFPYQALKYNISGL